MKIIDKIIDFLLKIKKNRKDTSSSEWLKGYEKWKSGTTESEKLQDELEPLPDMKMFNTKRGNPFKEGTD